MAVRLLISLVFLLLAGHLRAQDIYMIDTLYPVHDLDPILEVLPDPDHELTAAEVIRDSSLEFALRSSFPKYLEIGTAYWGKIRVKANARLEGWTLNLEDHWFNDVAWVRSNGKVDVYAFAGEELLFHKKTGADYPRSEREYPKKWILNRVNLDLPADRVVTVLIRVEGNSFGFFPFFNATLRKPGFQNYHPLLPFNGSFKIFLFGVTFIIFLYHFLQFLYLRQEIFFWFSLWVGLCMLTQAMVVGLDTELLLGNVPSLRFLVWIIIPSSILFTFWFFGRSFVKSREKFPRLDRFMLALPLSMIAFIVLILVLTLMGNPVVFNMSVSFHFKFIIIYSILGLALAIILAFQKDRFARYFGIGAIIGTCSTLIGGLWSDQVIRLSFDPYGWGVFLQTIAYSFGIAYRQQQLTQQAQEEKLDAERSRSEIERIKDLDEIKSRFFANISHEFRTPLSLIIGPIRQARNRNADSGTTIQLSPASFSVIERNAGRLETLVDQLLDLSKIENGQVHLRLTRGGLIRFVRSIVFSFESMAERNNISLNTSFPPEIDIAFYDKDKLEKILSNLLSNAFKYTPTGGAVTVSVQYDDQHFIIEISDTGKGIEKEYVRRIFERFYRVEGSEEKGSGIGLALTKELVDLHRGQISVNSEKGQGTSFKVRIPYTLEGLPPALREEADDDRSMNAPFVNRTTPEESLEWEAPAEGPQLRELPVVLIVEDNADLRNFIAGILDGSYQVLSARDGLQGERMTMEHIPDLVITDVMMPQKDGYELCHTLKNNMKTSHIPILMLTAKAGQSNKMEGLMQGADAYLTKPFDANELLIRIKNLIEARKRMWEHFQALDLVLVDDLEVTSADDKFFQQVVQVIQKNLDNEHLSVEDLARTVGFSRSQLHRKLKALTDKSASQLIAEIRLNEARRMLENKVGTVSEIAYSVGYSNLSYFTKSFKEKFGLLPSKVA